MNKYSIAEDIHLDVNHSTTYKTDIEQYGTPEHWCLAGKYGDCEDYALLKYIKLSQSGFDMSKVNIVVCQIPNRGGHAVLYVETDKGGFILDNCHNWPIAPNSLDYEWEAIYKNGKWYRLQGFTL